MEGRFELVQADRGGWHGVTGVQYFTRDFEAIGAEAFVLPNESSQLGLFTLQEMHLGALGLDAAGRVAERHASAQPLVFVHIFMSEEHRVAKACVSACRLQ